MTAGGTERGCVHCDRPATHKHAHTGEPLCCGHASWDIDAEPIRDGHSCEKFYTVERESRDLECEHRDNPNPPTGDLVLCEQTAEWRITTSRFPGDPVEANHSGTPTATRYCPRHFAERLGRILNASDSAKLEVRPRDW